MTRLRIVSAGRMEKLLFALGFEWTRQKGSHAFYRHPDGRTTPPRSRAKALYAMHIIYGFSSDIVDRGALQDR